MLQDYSTAAQLLRTSVHILVPAHCPSTLGQRFVPHYNTIP